MGEVDPKEAGDVAYMLANGQGETRAGKCGEMRLPARWRLVFLSTGEVTLESHLASIGKRVVAHAHPCARAIPVVLSIKAGQQVRVIEISADTGAQMGMFNHSHGMNAADLADHLKQQSRQHYGNLALDWLRYLTEHSDQVRPVFQTVRQRFLARLPIDADGQVRSFIEQHGESRFTPKQTGYSNQVRQRTGWIDTKGPQTLYLFYPTGWREGHRRPKPRTAAKALLAAGYLIPDGNRPQRKVSLPDNTRPRMYCIKGNILDD